MGKTEIEKREWLIELASRHNLSLDLIEEYRQLFQQHRIPVAADVQDADIAENIIMVSTHGYWGDPPPAGVPDTGGQTYYVLEVSKAWASQGRKVIILARWFEPYPRVEKFADNLWLVRINAGGDEFIRKEDIYSLVPEMAEAATAIAALFGADAVMGHYADGMAGATEVGERLKIPVVNIPHSMGIKKLMNLGLDPFDPESWFDTQYNFWIRESYELTALKGANLEIANTPAEPKALMDYYGACFPHLIMPAGAGMDFFEAFEEKELPEILSKHNLGSKHYLMFFGRLSEAKNIPATVAILGEARKIEPEIFNKINLVVIGGDPENPTEEEESVENGIKEKMNEYGLTNKDVIRIPSLNWGPLSSLAHHSLAYVGMQIMEPFGMSVAEAMAAGAPALISKNAGITRWLRDGENSVIVDPEDPKGAAAKLAALIKDKERLNALSINGHEFSKENFSWSGIAKRIGRLLDQLYKNEAPSEVAEKEEFMNVFRQREGRAYHRLSFVWRGDPPIIRDKHKKAASGILPYIMGAVEGARKSGERLTIALGGESGAGKTEIAEYLRFLLRREGVWAATMPGDAFFKLTPAKNHHAREEAFKEGRLKEYLGPEEVDLDRLDVILGDAKKRTTDCVFIPSDCRRLKSRRYDNVPLNLEGRDIALVDLTYSLMLNNANLKIFLESDYKKRIEEIRERNLARDPDQDFDFILKVLEIEHSFIQTLRKEANLIVTQDYEVKIV